MDLPQDPAAPDPRVGRILDILAEETGIDRARLQPDASVEELGITSLDMTQAVFKLETVFDIEIPVIAERAGTEFGTIGELVGHVLAVLDETGRAPEGGTG
ncbi:MAG: phosphopantetheine-binding protein [Pseudomonadota bacterium]|nr:phosphopantetheine-binding protein [Pseudomonadota bacterium]